MKKLVTLAGFVALAALPAQAILYTPSWSTGLANGGLIPDNDYSGWANSQTITAAPAGTLQSVAVSLQLSGGWNGDLYAYLVNSSGGFSVLLNRVGTGTYGYGDAGMNVILADSGANTTLGVAPTRNIANYQSIVGPGAPSGIWNPDNTTGSLGSFLSGPANGTWTLFIADLNSGDVSTVQNWGLQMDIVAVPELESWIAAALAGAFGAYWLNRQIWNDAPKA
jgi:subtilisin-like proprotein convertase family protein